MYKNNILVLISILIVLLIVNIILTYNCYKKNKAENFTTFYFKNKAGFKDSISDMHYANLISKVGTLHYKELDVINDYTITSKNNKKNLQMLKCYLSKNNEILYADILNNMYFNNSEGVQIDSKKIVNNSEAEGCVTNNSKIMNNLNDLINNHTKLQNNITKKLKKYNITN